MCVCVCGGGCARVCVGGACVSLSGRVLSSRFNSLISQNYVVNQPRKILY